VTPLYLRGGFCKRSIFALLCLPVIGVRLAMTGQGGPPLAGTPRERGIYCHCKPHSKALANEAISPRGIFECMGTILSHTAKRGIPPYKTS